MNYTESEFRELLLTTAQGVLTEMQAQSQSLHSIARSQQGLWECCLAGRSGNNLLLEISMLHYKMPPDQRWKLYLQRLAELEGRTYQEQA